MNEWRRQEEESITESEEEKLDEMMPFRRQ